ncbi:MAG: hypothetical protein ACOY8P_05525 [Thermodesulfobacteriota bacterium]
MTLFTKDDCLLCEQIKKQFDLKALDVKVEVLNSHDAEALAHLAWHRLVETARKRLPILVLDDSSSVDEFSRIERHLAARAEERGVAFTASANQAGCESGSCAL